jgi:hypothetical protein
MDPRFFIVSLVFVGSVGLCGIIFLPFVLVGLYCFVVFRYLRNKGGMNL